MTPFDTRDVIRTACLDLTPLQVDDADELVTVLADERLHEFIGGRPATLSELRVRYASLVAGPTDPNEVWLNWIARNRADSQAVGTLQVTLVEQDGHRTAYVAWVIGVAWQGQGFASEAARAVVDWLRRQGIHTIEAHIHPAHHASASVAARAGLHRTNDEVDGEQVWRVP